MLEWIVLVTNASQQTLERLREPSYFQWYIIPLLAIVFYIYANEIQRARKTGNWNIIYAGAALFGADLINECWNSAFFHATNHSAFWTTPGHGSGLVTMIGWNIEIMFMFSIAGIVFGKLLPEDKSEKVDLKFIQIPNRWFWAIGFTILCVFVEVLLNSAGALVWEYPFWNASFGGIWLIFFVGYFWFYVVAFVAYDLEPIKKKQQFVGAIYGIGLVMLLVFGLAGWV